MTLCAHCSSALSQGSRRLESAPELQVVSTGSGTIGGRNIEAAILRCPLCNAVWQREIDLSTLKELWYLKAGV